MIKILLVSDNVMFRSALATALAGTDELEVIGEAGCGAVPPCGWAVPPDVAIVDLDTNGDPPFEVVRELARRLSGCRILAITAGPAPDTRSRALHSAVRGFVSRNNDLSQLIAAVRTVAAGGKVIEARIALAALALPRNPLTVRELEVLQLVAQGLPVADIAQRLYLTSGTVRNYLSAIMRKVGARNRLEAVHTAQESHWL